MLTEIKMRDVKRIADLGPEVYISNTSVTVHINPFGSGDERIEKTDYWEVLFQFCSGIPAKTDDPEMPYFDKLYVTNGSRISGFDFTPMGFQGVGSTYGILWLSSLLGKRGICAFLVVGCEIQPLTFAYFICILMHMIEMKGENL